MPRLQIQAPRVCPQCSTRKKSSHHHNRVRGSEQTRSTTPPRAEDCISACKPVACIILLHPRSSRLTDEPALWMLTHGIYLLTSRVLLTLFARPYHRDPALRFQTFLVLHTYAGGIYTYWLRSAMLAHTGRSGTSTYSSDSGDNGSATVTCQSVALDRIRVVQTHQAAGYRLYIA